MHTSQKLIHSQLNNLHTWELSGWYKVNSYDLVNAAEFHIVRAVQRKDRPKKVQTAAELWRSRVWAQRCTVMNWLRYAGVTVWQILNVSTANLYVMHCRTGTQWSWCKRCGARPHWHLQNKLGGNALKTLLLLDAAGCSTLQEHCNSRFSGRFRLAMPTFVLQKLPAANTVPVFEKTCATSQKNIKVMFLQRVSTACYAERCISYSKSVRLSVCPSIRLSVTRWHWVKTTQATIMGSSLEDSPMILSFQHA